jgi:hypothetical protein
MYPWSTCEHFTKPKRTQVKIFTYTPLYSVIFSCSLVYYFISHEASHIKIYMLHANTFFCYFLIVTSMLTKLPQGTQNTGLHAHSFFCFSLKATCVARPLSQSCTRAYTHALHSLVVIFFLTDFLQRHTYHTYTSQIYTQTS